MLNKMCFTNPNLLVISSLHFATVLALSGVPWTRVSAPLIGRHVIARSFIPMYSTVTISGGVILMLSGCDKHLDKKCDAPFKSCPATFAASS